MKALVLGNGTPPPKELLRREKEGAELIVCADGAAQWALSEGVTPDVLLGDMDSVSSVSLAELESMGVSIVRFPSEKDDTDMMLAAQHAVERGATEIVLLGATGGRLDHALGNLQVLSYLRKRGVAARMRDEYCSASVLSGRMKAAGKPGDVFSVVPLCQCVKIIELSGVKYPLRNYTMEFERPLGISNEFAENEMTLDVSGYVAFILVNGDLK